MGDDMKFGPACDCSFRHQCAISGGNAIGRTAKFTPERFFGKTIFWPSAV
ncbi:hypothetical protein Agau_L100896 [Agrobacterium tumefaciens F2]|nr:hypothetical protein Agau_L100896 [Agrobacterium tumefaciens F2]